MEEQFTNPIITGSKSPRSVWSRGSASCRLPNQIHFAESCNEPVTLIRPFNQCSFKQMRFSMMRHREKHIGTPTHSHPSHNDPKKICDWTKEAEKELSASKSTNNQVEYMEVDDLDSIMDRLTFNVSIASTSVSAINSEQSLPLKSNEDLVKPILTEEKYLEEDNSDRMSGNKRNWKPNNYEDMKKKIRPLVPKRPLKEKRNHFCTCFKLLFSILFFICILLISIIIQRTQNLKHNVDFSDVISELKKQIHGQDNAVQSLSEYLQLDTPALKVIALVGGTGIGKSYTVEIIKSHFPRQYPIRQDYPPIEGTIENIGSLFPLPRLIILENLKERDLMTVVNYLKTVDELADQYITVIAVFNVEQMDDDSVRSIDMDGSLKTIRDSFSGESIDVKIIPYVPLSENDIEKCIVEVARHSRLTLSDRQINLVKESLLANNAGCKGAYSKAQVVGRQ